METFAREQSNGLVLDKKLTDAATNNLLTNISKTGFVHMSKISK
jgi:hypothetical protein